MNVMGCATTHFVASLSGALGWGKKVVKYNEIPITNSILKIVSVSLQIKDIKHIKQDFNLIA